MKPICPTHLLFSSVWSNLSVPIHPLSPSLFLETRFLPEAPQCSPQWGLGSLTFVTDSMTEKLLVTDIQMDGSEVLKPLEHRMTTSVKIRAQQEPLVTKDHLTF